MLTHEKYMQRCIALAEKGIRAAMPNPCVGAVIVHEDQIIGEGHTAAYGGPHAEVNAIQSVQQKTLLRNSTLYVSLEPCNHYGKTPPCSQLIVNSGIPRVVLGIRDPFKAVNGAGIATLLQAGIQVTEGVLADSCQHVNRRFFTFHQQERPYIHLQSTLQSLTEPVVITDCSQQQLLQDAIQQLQDFKPMLVVIDPATENITLLQHNGVSFTSTRQSLTLHDLLKTLHEKKLLSVQVTGSAPILNLFHSSGLYDEMN